ncbi:MAG TPA: ribonucleotide reductase N-terminal alpha domain-containing protein, partial [bacterium]|nr:ribonucleotide reductase N-terminal alpha domain-containing protein [bacterium]
MNTNKNPTKAITELKLSVNARQVLAARYLQRDGEGQLSETPEQLFSRVADAVAAAEVLLNNDSGFTHWRDVFHRMLTSLEFLPNSPTLMNAGTTVGQLSACFVLPVTDTKEDISDTVKQITPIQRTGGGTGFAFSHLRPRGEVVAATGEVAS